MIGSCKWVSPDPATIRETPLVESTQAPWLQAPSGSEPLPEDLASHVSVANTKTIRITLEFVLRGKLTFEADFEEPRTLQQLAQEQRQFLDENRDGLLDVDLPPMGERGQQDPS